ncbi:hypothetical protein Mapa_017079 [Marchantia paleacea]|nr:hypothetical protein Mapa_017079 [Marchantia paleacea]
MRCGCEVMMSMVFDGSDCLYMSRNLSILNVYKLRTSCATMLERLTTSPHEEFLQHTSLIYTTSSPGHRECMCYIECKCCHVNLHTTLEDRPCSYNCSKLRRHS